MSRPTDFTKQCPTCQYQDIIPRCHSGKQRINKNDSGEYFKAVDCVLWEARKAEEAVEYPRVCPTCGKPIDAVCIVMDEERISQSLESLGPQKLHENTSDVTPQPETIEDKPPVIDEPPRDPNYVPPHKRQYVKHTKKCARRKLKETVE